MLIEESKSDPATCVPAGTRAQNNANFFVLRCGAAGPKAPHLQMFSAAFFV